ncbi:MAG: ferritin-like fold-containing protein [Candidatus Nanopelagicales bacterium]
MASDDRPRVPISADMADWTDEYRAGVIDLLGVLAYGELSACQRMAADAALAPTLADQVQMMSIVDVEMSHFTALRDRLEEMGADVLSAMAPFRTAIAGFHDQTAPKDWWEGLVKVYVGDGIASDFYREIATYVDPDTRALVLSVCSDVETSDYVIAQVRAQIERDPKVGGRLALWGRRLVGEALSQAQRVAADRDGLTHLLVGGVDHPGADLAEIGRMLARLTDAHTRRMQALGLAS